MNTINNPDFIKQTGYHSHESRMIFTVDPDKLLDDECHCLLPANLTKDMLALSHLEFTLFHPDTNLADQFKFDHVKSTDFNLFWIRFPKKYLETCRNIAKLYDLTIGTKGRVMMCKGDLMVSVLEFPVHEKLIVFVGDHEIDEASYHREFEVIKMIGSVLQNTVVD